MKPDHWHTLIGTLFGTTFTLLILDYVIALVPEKYDLWFGGGMLAIIVLFWIISGKLQDWAELYYHHIVTTLLETNAKDVITAISLPTFYREYITHLVGAGHVGCVEGFCYFVTEQGIAQHELNMAGCGRTGIRYPETDY
jgi:hypothetical protein